MVTAKNPILSGFYPDPSICRAGEDYDIENSSFVYAPGIPMVHSRYLAHWEQIENILDRPEQLPVKGSEISQGICAPSIRFHDGLFYMITTNVSYGGNFIVTAKDPAGPWSDPYYLGEDAPGIDPSLFFDDDGKCYYCGTRPNPEGVRYNGDWEIWVQELDLRQMKLVGESMAIWKGAVKGVIWPEGPHIYKKDGYYYLLTAEGGTEYGHAETVARARNVDGPYGGAPDNPLLTARNRLDLPLQKAGHADLVSTENGEWYLVHLTGRPLPPYRRCILGRETAIQKVTWKNDWPYVVNGPEPSEEIEVSWEVEHRKPEKKEYVFTQEMVLPEFHSLRIPLKEAASLTARPGWLRLVGKDSPNSRFEQTLLMRRQEDFCFSFETAMEFSPISERQMAGILYFYDECDFYYLRITTDTEGKRIIDCMIMDHGKASYQGTQRLSGNGLVYLKVRVKNTEGSFSFSYDRKVWYNVGGVWDASKISDEYPEEGAYTGAMVGIGCHDML